MCAKDMRQGKSTNTVEREGAATMATVKRYELTPLDKIPICAEVLGISERQMRRMCEKGEVLAVKVASTWRINTKALLEQFGLN